MLKSDAIDLFDLSEAGRLLFRDPARLAREARLRQIPATWVGERLALPVAWVEAEAGIQPVDPEAVRSYWIERLAPPSPDAHRATRERERLPVEELLTARDAARRVHADPLALRRLDLEGTLPSVRVDGVPHYDAQLTALVAEAEESTAEERRARTAQVRGWARFEYVTVTPPGQTPRTPNSAGGAARFEVAESAPGEARVAEPGAFEIPTGLELDQIAPLESGPLDPPSRLIEADGFDVVDED